MTRGVTGRGDDRYVEEARSLVPEIDFSEFNPDLPAPISSMSMAS